MFRFLIRWRELLKLKIWHVFMTWMSFFLLRHKFQLWNHRLAKKAATAILFRGIVTKKRILCHCTATVYSIREGVRVHPRPPSVAFPISNCRAQASVKNVKRLITNNTNVTQMSFNVTAPVLQHPWSRHEVIFGLPRPNLLATVRVQSLVSGFQVSFHHFFTTESLREMFLTYAYCKRSKQELFQKKWNE